MESPNGMALDLVDEAIDFADELNVGVHHLEDEAAVLDFGVEAPGGVEAGLLLAEVASGGLATVQARAESAADAALTHVELSTDHPHLSLLGCQSPGWSLEIDGTAVRGSGPAQLFRESGDDDHDPDRGATDDEGEHEHEYEYELESEFEETFDFAVLAVETGRLPGEALTGAVAAEAGVPTSGVFVLAAPANSVAGVVAAAARAAGLAVRWLVANGYDPADVLSVTAAAPVAPLAASEAEARARSAAAIANGGRAHVVVERDVDTPGRFDRTDPGDVVQAPAQITVDVAGGPTHVVGGVDDDDLADALGV